MPKELWMEVCNIVQEAVTKIIPKKKKFKTAEWLSEKTFTNINIGAGMGTFKNKENITKEDLTFLNFHVTLFFSPFYDIFEPRSIFYR